VHREEEEEEEKIKERDDIFFGETHNRVVRARLIASRSRAGAILLGLTLHATASACSKARSNFFSRIRTRKE